MKAHPWLSLVCLVSLASGSALSQVRPGDPAAGRTVATRHCAGCHAVSADQSRPATDAAPAFITLARDASITEESLRLFLKTPHARMPSVLLSPDEAEHVISYILRLRANN